MNSDIKTFRRFALAFVSILFLGLAASSLAQGKAKLVKSLYRVELTGIYIHNWHSQTEEFPRTDREWGTERGKIISGFHTRGNGILFRGMRFKGKLPKELRDVPFQFYPLARAVTKVNNRQKITIRRNHIPACGGEAGPCTGNEPRGIKTTSKSCAKPNARLPFSLDYSDLTPMLIKFSFDQSNYEFCGKGYPYFASVDELPTWLMVSRGVDRIAALKRGQKRTWKFSKGFGEKVPLNSNEAVKTKKCPSMSGPGAKRCWTTDLTLEVTRVK